MKQTKLQEPPFSPRYGGKPTGMRLIWYWALPLTVSTALNLALLIYIQWSMRQPIELPVLQIQMLAQAKAAVEQPVREKKPLEKPKKKKPPPKKNKPKPKLKPPKKPPPETPAPTPALVPKPVAQPMETESREEPIVEEDVVEAVVEEAQPQYQPMPLHLLTKQPSGTNMIQPDYPVEEKSLGREVDVLVSYIITPKGRAANIKILRSGGDKFDREVMKALEKSSFSPGYRNGVAVATSVTQTFEFRLI